MGFLKNTWVNYVERSFEQIRSKLLTGLQNEVPEITDHNTSNPFVKIISFWAAIAENLGYYIDNGAREAFIDSCRLYRSAVSIATLMDYRIKSYSPATVILVFSLEEAQGTDVTIPIGTVCQAGLIPFQTVEECVIPAGELTISCEAKQWTLVEGLELGTGNNTPNQSFELPANLADGSAVVSVDGSAWESQNTFGYSIPASEHYVVTVNKNRRPLVRFGNGMNGKLVANGLTVTADYYETFGASGNVAAGTITTGNLPTGVSVTNPNRAVGGADIEGMDELKKRIPLSVRTLERAVTKQDFIDLLELHESVEQADIVFNCGKSVEGYIVPQGGGIATQTLLNTLVDYMDDKKIIGRFLTLFTAGEVRLKFVIEVVALPSYQNSVVAEICKNAVLAETAKNKIRTPVYLSNIYGALEATNRISHAVITVMQSVPYPKQLTEATPLLDWEVELKEGSVETLKWKLQMTGATVFQVFKGNAFIGTFDGEYEDAVVKFTLQGTYTANDTWEFHTYPFYGTLILDEPSVAVTLPEDIEINVTGGF